MNEEFERCLASIVASDIESLSKSESRYGRSWCKRGGVQAYFSFVRKIDRIEFAAKEYGYDIFKAIFEERGGDGRVDGKDSLLDDVRDLRRYLLLLEVEIIKLMKCMKGEYHGCETEKEKQALVES